MQILTAESVEAVCLVHTIVTVLKAQNAHCCSGAYVTWPLIDPDARSIDGSKIVARRLNVIGKQAKAAGLLVAYHNHDFEFVQQNGQLGYDIILNETDPALVKLQVDLYWLARASQDPVQWFKR